MEAHMLRKCSKCGEEKEIDRFVRQTGKYREDPYRKDCKDCKNAKRRKNTISSTIFVKGQKAWNKGIKADPEIIKKMIEGRKGQVTWNKGKIYGKGRTITCGKYKEWRLSVLKRDEYKCRKCII